MRLVGYEGVGRVSDVGTRAQRRQEANPSNPSRPINVSLDWGCDALSVVPEGGFFFTRIAVDIVLTLRLSCARLLNEILEFRPLRGAKRV